MKINFGDVTNFETKQTADVVVNKVLMIRPKHLLIGAGLVVSGIGYMIGSAFKYGCDSFIEAENDALKIIGCITGEGKE